MQKTLKTLVAVMGAAGLAVSAMQAHAQDKVKIGFITDMSSLYADVEGKNGALAIQMAIDDFGGKVLGKPIELLSADHQNKADIAASKAREWIDTQNLTMLFGGTNSGTALAMAKVAEEKKRVYFNSGAGSSALTNAQCTPYTEHYAYATVALAKGTGGAIVALCRRRHQPVLQRRAGRRVRALLRLQLVVRHFQLRRSLGGLLTAAPPVPLEGVHAADLLGGAGVLCLVVVGYELRSFYFRD